MLALLLPACPRWSEGGWALFVRTNVPVWACSWSGTTCPCFAPSRKSCRCHVSLKPASSDSWTIDYTKPKNKCTTWEVTGGTQDGTNRLAASRKLTQPAEHPVLSLMVHQNRHMWCVKSPWSHISPFFVIMLMLKKKKKKKNAFSNLNAKNSFLQMQQVHLWRWWGRREADGNPSLSRCQKAWSLMNFKGERSKRSGGVHGVGWGIAVKCTVANAWSGVSCIISLVLILIKLVLWRGKCDSNGRKPLFHQIKHFLSEEG